MSMERAIDSERMWARLWAAGLAIYWPLLLFALHWPIPLSRFPSNHSDKLVHVLLYGVFAFLAAGVIETQAGYFPWFARQRRAQRMLLVLLAVTLHGLCDEVTQPLTGRTFDWWDLLADMLGAVVALAVFLCLALCVRRR